MMSMGAENGVDMMAILAECVVEWEVHQKFTKICGTFFYAVMSPARAGSIAVPAVLVKCQFWGTYILITIQSQYKTNAMGIWR